MSREPETLTLQRVPVALLNRMTVYSLGGMQRRKDIWGDDALEWRPDRWEGADVDRWHFIPYNQYVLLNTSYGELSLMLVNCD